MIALRLCAAAMCLATVAFAQETAIGIIGRAYEDGHPVIYKFVNVLPADTIRGPLGWLTVVSWKYDGSGRNGLPSEATNKSMIALEAAIEASVCSKNVCQHAYSRTGNYLKELVFYSTSQDEFMKELNVALAKQPRYPIEIKFYEDKSWNDFRSLLDRFSKSKRPNARLTSLSTSRATARSASP